MESQLHKEADEIAGLACCQIQEASVPIRKVWKMVKYTFILGAVYEKNKKSDK